MAEKILQEKIAKSPVSQDGQLSGETGQVIQELQVHQIELELQNQQLRQNQVELDAARRRYFDLYDMAPVGYCTINENGLIMESNLTAADLLGVTREELIMQPISRYILHEDQDQYYLFRKRFREAWAPRGRTAQTHPEQPGEHQKCDLRMVKKDGTTFWVHLMASSTQDHEGAPAHRVVLSDITERKLAEAQRIKFEARNHRIRKAESLERMATVIAHLFNNQFHVVLGNLELALDGLATDADPRKNVIKAIQAIHRSSEVNRQLLAYLGQNNVNLEPLDLSEMCRRNMPEIESVTPDYITLQIDLVFPGPVVRANANQIKHVLASLITNGWEAMRGRAGGGEVKVVTKTLPASRIPRTHVFPTGWVPAATTFACLEVSDTGCGMSAEEVDKIFDPFYSTKAIGRGLGLAVVIGIIKAWGGMISVKTAVGAGSSFGVFVPRLVDVALRRNETPIKQGGLEAGGAVLLVDDDGIVRNIAESLLKHIGFTVFAAASGDEAFALLQNHRDTIKCFLTDLSMPGKDGWETIAALREIKPHLPAILSSGYDENKAMSGDHVEFPQAFLQKPYTMANLKEILCRVLGNEAKNN